MDEVRKHSAQLIANKITLAITVFEKSPSTEPLGPGFAYNPKQNESNLINSALDYVSIYGGDDIEHFLKWLIKEKAKWGPQFPQILRVLETGKLSMTESYVPRKLAGLYMVDCWENSLIEAKSLPMTVDIVREDVSDVKVTSLET